MRPDDNRDLDKSQFVQPSSDDEDPPLLEGKHLYLTFLDLDIDLKQITQRIVSVMSFRGVDKEIIEDADMAGPAIVAIVFGFLLLLVGNKGSHLLARKSVLWVYLWIWDYGMLRYFQFFEGYGQAALEFKCAALHHCQYPRLLPPTLQLLSHICPYTRHTVPNWVGHLRSNSSLVNLHGNKIHRHHAQHQRQEDPHRLPHLPLLHVLPPPRRLLRDCSFQ